MDLIQFIVGIVLLLTGVGTSFKSRDSTQIFAGVVLIIVGIAFIFGSWGMRI